MKILLIIIAIIFAICVAVFFIGCCKISSDISKKERRNKLFCELIK